jgi:C-terminal peptidase prc
MPGRAQALGMTRNLLLLLAILAPHLALAEPPRAPIQTVGPPIAVLGTLQDWRGIRFQGPQFHEVRQYAQDHWLEAPPDTPQAWIAAANGGLWTLTPTAELVPEAFLSRHKDLPADHGRYAGTAAPLQCGGHVLPGVLLHRVPPAAEKWRPEPSEVQAHTTHVRDRRAELRAAWALVPFDRKAFECAMAWLETELLRNGGGAVPLPGLGDEERQAGGGPDFAWINAASAWLKSLDPHSDVVSRVFWDRVSQPMTSAPVADVGLMLEEAGGTVRVADVVRDGPAWRAGVRVGDMLEQIQSKPVQFQSARGLLEGKAGVGVKLVLRRAGKPMKVTLVRRVQTTPDVEARMLDEDPAVGLLQVHDFVEHTSNTATAAMLRVNKAAHGKLRAWVIDLRDNGGGVLDEAVRLADHLLAHGHITRTRNRAQPEKILDAHADPDDVALPVVVLVGPGCASACEVLTSALRENGRAVVVGERTYGKASVQQLFRPFAAAYYVKLTIARYYSPGGGSLQAVGVPPDVEARARPGGDALVHAREEDLTGHLQAQEGPADPGNPLATAALRTCVDQTGRAIVRWGQDPTPRARPDLPILTALDVVRCLLPIQGAAMAP